MILYIFVFNQKTAQDMRISDWSSDVCSSDVAGIFWELAANRRCTGSAARPYRSVKLHDSGFRCILRDRRFRLGPMETGSSRLRIAKSRISPKRSEEHTSELQSLMRHSYAVFCLKTKKNNMKTYKYEQ